MITGFAVSHADFALSFQTLLGMGYDIERETELAGSNWSVLFTNVPGTGGIVQVSDTSSPLESSQFYRVRLSP